MFEVNKLGCMMSPEGGDTDYIASCSSVEEAVVITGNKPQGGEEELWRKSI